MTQEPALRRNGDIIILLPLMQKIAAKAGKPVRMLVTQDMLPLLEGVSYVEPVTDTAKANGAVDAKVFVRGLIPTTLPNNYAELAWHRLGHKWDAGLPLVFDKRDKRREGRLARSALKTDSPALLLKLEGGSSPLPNAGVIRDRITERFKGSFEVVNLDAIRAERLYDLIGLMDRASCMVTVDTCTLWLAHASPVPVIALVHPMDYRSSPARGNCIGRIRYEDVEKKWPIMERLIAERLAVS